MSLVACHPVITYFLNEFQKEKSFEPTGIKVGDMGQFKIEDELTVKVEYLVCANQITLETRKIISCIGPGGGLIAGSDISLCSPTITLEGEKNQPIKVVGIKGITIIAHHLTIKNVIFYLLDNAALNIHLLNISRCKNVKVIRLTVNDNQLSGKIIADWPDIAALNDYEKKQLEKKQCLLEKANTSNRLEEKTDSKR